MHPCPGNWLAIWMRSCIMPGLPQHLMELNVGTVPCLVVSAYISSLWRQLCLLFVRRIINATVSPYPTPTLSNMTVEASVIYRNVKCRYHWDRHELYLQNQYPALPNRSMKSIIRYVTSLVLFSSLRRMREKYQLRHKISHTISYGFLTSPESLLS